MSTYLNNTVHCTRIAGNFLKEMFDMDFSIEQKGKRDFVTSADKGSEELILEYLKEAYPEHRIISEEKGTSGKQDSEYIWYVDPLDGTTNFIHHIPYFNVSIALEYKNQIICGAVYNPILDEVFYAEVGKGAFLNGKAIKPREVSLEDAFIGICHGKSDEEINVFLKIMKILKFRASDVRKLGSAGLELCYTACGRIDGFIGYGVKPWDFKAGMLICLESGCKIGGIRQENVEENGLVAASDKIYNDIKSIIREVI